jgi:two-component system, repressor protein LuxO
LLYEALIELGHGGLMSVATLLLIESDPVQQHGFREVLERMGYKIARAPSLELAARELERDRFDLILLNLDIDPKESANWLQQKSGGRLNVVVYTSRGSVATAVEAMRSGAHDFLILPVAPEKLQVTVKNALAYKQLQHTVAAYRHQDRPGFQGFIGSSPQMQAVYKIIEQAAASKASVFITGESGTGKEVAAQAIHALSPRASGPFVALNCAAIPKDLMESEVFGHVKGAFTGATADREGAARQADGGTLFLDEIGEMDAGLQSKLLRFLQTGTFQRVGGSKPESVDVRIVCATNRDPLMEVEAGRFREDLYYRLHVLPIALPPLRERGHDITEIALHLLQQTAAEEHKPFTGFTPEAARILQNYDWPGNVRQLQNVIRNIVVMHAAAEVTPEMIPPPVGGRWARPHGFAGRVSLAVPVPSEVVRIRPLAEVERDAIEQAIALCEGNVPKAAALLDVSPSTIYRKQQGWRQGQA